MCIRISVQRGVLLSRWALTLKWLARVQKKEMAEPLIKMCCILLDVRVVSDVEVHGLSSKYVTEQVLLNLFRVKLQSKSFAENSMTTSYKSQFVSFPHMLNPASNTYTQKQPKCIKRKTIGSFVQRHQVFLCFGLHSYSYDMSGKHPHNRSLES